MQGHILYDAVVVKPGPEPYFYKATDPDIHPTTIQDYGLAYTYRFVDGRRAELSDVSLIRTVAQEKMWSKLHKGTIDVEAYIAYVATVKTEPISAFATESIPTLQATYGILREANLPLCYKIHGDMTLENIVIIPRDGGNWPIFIDPGDPRGMFTPALDRGKLLQSVVMRWEERKQEGPAVWEDPRPWPDWADEVDWAFLVTHWARLQRHWPGWNTDSAWPVLERLRP